MTKQAPKELDSFIELLVHVAEELQFENNHKFMQKELKFISTFPDFSSFGPYADHWYGCLENYAEQYIKSKNVSLTFEAKGEEIAETIFDSWCEPEDNQIQKFIDELKAIPILDNFYKKYGLP